MTEAELRLGKVVRLEALEELRCVQTNAADEVLRYVVGGDIKLECALNGCAKDRFPDTENDLRLLVWLGEVELQ